METKYNIIMGVCFDGSFLAYCKDDSSYTLRLCDDKNLNNFEPAKFAENELEDAYRFLAKYHSVAAATNAKKYTFKVGQSKALNNPFKK